jgi:hypothetical protein
MSSTERRLDRLVVAERDRGVGDPARHRVGLVHARGAAEGVARKLVEEEDQRQRAGGAAEPAGAFAARCGAMRGDEAFSEFCVERRVLREPQFWAGLAPKGDDVLGCPSLTLKAGGQGRRRNGCVHGQDSPRETPILMMRH